MGYFFETQYGIWAISGQLGRFRVQHFFYFYDYFEKHKVWVIKKRQKWCCKHTVLFQELSLFWNYNSLPAQMCIIYSIVKDSNADLGVIFKFLQNSPITKEVCTKMSKNFFLHFWQYFDISERKQRGIIFDILNI